MAHMHNPPHPGLPLRDDVLPALGLSVTEAAQQLSVARVALSRVLNGRAAISPEMALRIEAWLGVERGGEGTPVAGRTKRLRPVASAQGRCAKGQSRRTDGGITSYQRLARRGKNEPSEFHLSIAPPFIVPTLCITNRYVIFFLRLALLSSTGNRLVSCW
jgi:addiction module HigA family antidote